MSKAYEIEILDNCWSEQIFKYIVIAGNQKNAIKKVKKKLNVEEKNIVDIKKLDHEIII